MQKRSIMRMLVTIPVTALFTLSWACVSVPNDIDTGGCIRECKDDADGGLKACLGMTADDCPAADECFAQLELCFDTAGECAKGCTGCEDDGSCPEGEDACSDACTDKASKCTDGIDMCVNIVDGCMTDSVSKKEKCFDVFIECTAVCIDEVERRLKQL